MGGRGFWVLRGAVCMAGRWGFLVRGMMQAGQADGLWFWNVTGCGSKGLGLAVVQRVTVQLGCRTVL